MAARVYLPHSIYIHLLDLFMILVPNSQSIQWLTRTPVFENQYPVDPSSWVYQIIHIIYIYIVVTIIVIIIVIIHIDLLLLLLLLLFSLIVQSDNIHSNIHILIYPHYP